MSFTMNLEKMVDWERNKAVYLLRVAEDLGMKVFDGSVGELSVNPNSGYTYLFSENYSFVLYMPISCELKKEDVMLLWTDLESGTEEVTELGDMTLEQINDWVLGNENMYKGADDE